MNFRKALACIFGLIFPAMASFAQTEIHKTGISIGGGPQDYKSNLGNGFKFLSKKNSWHGAAVVQVGTRMNRSFDLVFFGSIGDLAASRLKSVGILLKYKLADGHFLDESSVLKPYVFAGGAFNNLTDSTKKSNVNAVNYMSLNAGLGVRYYFSARIHLAYNLAVGYFIIANDVFLQNDGKNEMYFHNALLLGIDLF